jgi:uncharacterized protein (UPF0335 family)
MEERIKDSKVKNQKKSNPPSPPLEKGGKGGFEKGEKKEFNPQLIELLREAKGYGFSDRRIAKLLNVEESDIRRLRNQNNMHAVYKMVDTCGAEFAAYTPYLYSTYEKPFYKIPL